MAAGAGLPLRSHRGAAAQCGHARAAFGASLRERAAHRTFAGGAAARVPQDRRALSDEAARLGRRGVAMPAAARAVMRARADPRSDPRFTRVIDKLNADSRKLKQHPPAAKKAAEPAGAAKGPANE